MGHAAAATRRRHPGGGRHSGGRRRSGIRWDRVGRMALLLVLGVIVLLYAAPLQHWITQKRTASEHAAELRRLEAENSRLKRRARDLVRPQAVEREARRLGMVRQGERAYVIQGRRR